MEASAQQPTLDQWLSQASNGDGEAWRVLVETYTPRLYGLLMRQCRNPELAEEITQAAFVKVVTRLKDYQERGKFEPWLFRIAMNLLRDEMRRRKRQAVSMDMSDGQEEEPSAWQGVQHKLQTRQEGAEPGDHVERQEQIELLLKAISQLGEADQEILHLRHTAGLSFPEIAQTLEQPLGTVLARGHRALAKLKKLLGTTQEQVEL